MDFDVQPDKSVVVNDFTAIVLAGFGNELSPLTGDNGDEPCPKALLPIANRPMLEYPLSWIEQSGVRDVLLICPTSHRQAISHYIHSAGSTSFSSLRIDIHTYDQSQDSAVGTSAVLRHFAHRIQHDFVILPCDFVPPRSLSLARILNIYRTESESDGAIATTCWFEKSIEKASGQDEWDVQITPSPIVWDETTSTLLYVDTSEDQDRNGDDFEFRMSLLNRYPRSRLSSKFQDSHVYVCRRSVLDILQQKPYLTSFREDFMPWLVKPQYQRSKREKYGHALAAVTTTATQTVALKHSTLQVAPSQHTAHASSTPASPDEDDAPSQAVSASLRVGIVLHHARDGFTARANNLYAYLELNRRALYEPGYTYSLSSDPDRRSLIDPKAQISPDSMVGESTRVEERTNVKKSVVGKHCIVGKNAKVTGCVLLDHCVIGDGAKIENCILGKNTKVGARAELVRCVTQAGYEVNAGDSLKNEKLEVSDWTAPASDSEDEADAHSDSGSG